MINMLVYQIGDDKARPDMLHKAFYLCFVLTPILCLQRFGGDCERSDEGPGSCARVSCCSSSYMARKGATHVNARRVGLVHTQACACTP